jgi:hypothetical protein
MEWKMPLWILIIWNILRPLGIHIVWAFGNFFVIWHSLPRFGIVYLALV